MKEQVEGNDSSGCKVSPEMRKKEVPEIPQYQV